MSRERRRQTRFSWLRFESQVRVRRSFFKKEWIPVVPFDFSHFGMGMQTDEQFEIGEEVELSLELSKQDAVISIPSIKGVMRYKEKHHSRFNYGVEFVFSSRQQKFSVEEDLIRIEQALRHFESTRMRQPDDLVNGA